ncbi:hypothetical protein E4656_11155 [Natronospirillum operosum]|uniref:LysR substrate-binding domain-containing protein n=1 Tax=Natronospirillum operosum TaxID=2759953 RepID=A0A4Z0WFA0_9GAMM|nr:hypothetical protein E4656_11155 [Natronospirillum operosum]
MSQSQPEGLLVPVQPDLALVPDFLAQEELDEGKLVIPWDAPMTGTGSYYMAIPEHKFELEKIRALREWIRERC